MIPYMGWGRAWRIIHLFERGDYPRSHGAWNALQSEIVQAPTVKRALLKWRLGKVLDNEDMEFLFKVEPEEAISNGSH